MPEKLNLRQKLLAGETVMGPFLTMPSPDVVEMIAIAGFDFAIVDTEHGMYSEERAAQLVRAAAARSMAAVVRVPQ
ncbi:MAG: aldolase/citrate lyase family protein, partial [Chloroflexota bacterium]|nr:aldolase/citrate lyase family protein [Chloroflexota bacterium]